MTPRESQPQKETVERIMHEFKHGELRSGKSREKVKSRKQAIATALSEAGESNPADSERERRASPPYQGEGASGRNARDETEGKAAPHRRRATG
jgi:hypothetical protein